MSNSAENSDTNIHVPRRAIGERRHEVRNERRMKEVDRLDPIIGRFASRLDTKLARIKRRVEREAKKDDPQPRELPTIEETFRINLKFEDTVGAGVSIGPELAKRSGYGEVDDVAKKYNADITMYVDPNLNSKHDYVVIRVNPNRVYRSREEKQAEAERKMRLM